MQPIHRCLVLLVLAGVFGLWAPPRLAAESPDEALDRTLLDACAFPLRDLSFQVLGEVMESYNGVLAAAPTGSWEKSLQTRSGYPLTIERNGRTTLSLDADRLEGFYHGKIVFFDDANSGFPSRMALKETRHPTVNLTRFRFTLERAGDGIHVSGRAGHSGLDLVYDGKGRILELDSFSTDESLGIYQRTSARRKSRVSDGAEESYFTIANSLKFDGNDWCSTYHFWLESVRKSRVHSTEFYRFDPARCDEPFLCEAGVVKKIRADYLEGESGPRTITLTLQDNQKQQSYLIEGIAREPEEKVLETLIIKGEGEKVAPRSYRAYAEGRLNEADLFALMRPRMGSGYNEVVSYYHLYRAVSEKAGDSAWGDFASLIRYYKAGNILDPAKLCIAKTFCLAP